MLIQVRLYASLRRFIPDLTAGTAKEIDLAEDATVADLVAQLGLPATEVRVTFVNGRARPPEWILQSGDEVGIFPPIGGG